MKSKEEIENINYDEMSDEEYFDPFGDAEADFDDFSDESPISNALIGGLIVAGIIAVTLAAVATLSYFSVKMFKKTAKLLKS